MLALAFSDELEIHQYSKTGFGRHDDFYVDKFSLPLDQIEASSYWEIV